MAKRIAIIGGGMAGLSAGIFALQSGYDVTIYEKNHKLGGNCGTYYRNGYPIDHCIHWLIGTDKNSQQFQVWKKLHALSDDTEIISLPHLLTFYYKNTYVYLSRDYKFSHAQWLELFPEDKEMIDEFFFYVKHAIGINMVFKGESVKETRKKFKEFISQNVKHVGVVLKTSLILRSEYAQKFKNPVLRKIMENAQAGYGSLFSLLFEYACFINGNAGIPKGGAEQVIKNMEEYYEKLGGKVSLGTPVNEVVVKHKKIEYFKLETGQKVESDIYICATSPYYFHGTLNHGHYLGHSFKNVARKELGARMPSAYMISFAIPNKLVNLPTPTLISCLPFVVGDSIVSTLNLRVYDYDDIYIKDNKVVMNILIDQNKQDYLAWDRLDEQEYLQEKQRLIDTITLAITNAFPKLVGKIEYLDSFTPVSLEKYTNTPYGAYMSFPMTKKNPFFIHSPKCHPIDNLYYASQWIVSPGGLPLASANAEWCISTLNKDLKDRKKE